MRPTTLLGEGEQKKEQATPRDIDNPQDLPTGFLIDFRELKIDHGFTYLIF